MMGKYQFIECKGRITSPPEDFSIQDLDNIIKDKTDKLCCISCRTGITRQDLRKQINGNTEHTFTNPAAIQFHVICFADAENLIPQGQKVPQDSWFAGHCWQISLCNSCGLQLGWEFTGPSRFYALIANRLVNCKGD